jgi:hypothetical protein
MFVFIIIIVSIVLVIVLDTIGVHPKNITYYLLGTSGLIFLYYWFRGDVSGPCTYIEGYVLGGVAAAIFLLGGYCTLFLLSKKKRSP